MKKFFCIQLFSVVILLSPLTGYGEKKIDASTEEKMQSSVEEIKSSMSEKKKNEFHEAIKVILFYEIGKVWKTAKSAEEAKRKIRYSVHGKTADEVIAEARRIVAKHNKEKEAYGNQSDLEEKNEETKKNRLAEEKAKPVPTGAMGVKFGAIFTPPKEINESNTIKLPNGDLAYKYKTPIKFRDFKHVLLLITPKTHKVYAIWAYAAFDSATKAMGEYETVVSLIEKKYQVRPDFIPNPRGKACGLYFESSDIAMFVYTRQYRAIELKYTDRKLAKIAKEEKLELEAAKSDNSAI